MSTPNLTRILGPASVPTHELQANPHNPRRLFDEVPLKTLEESIRKVGVLVPLTVYRAAGSSKYTILDGQRRWICAQNIGLAQVPINEVAEPSIAENIVTMFQIHKLRLDWELMPTALKLDVLIKELKERGDKKLAELTGLDVAVVTRCKKLLWYPRQYQEMMLFADPDQRIKADFFIELYPILTDTVVKSWNGYSRDLLIDRFLYKYENKKSGLKAITDFRKIKQYIAISRAAGAEADFISAFERFVFDDKVDLSTLEIGVAAVHKTAEGISRSVMRLREEIAGLEIIEFIGEEKLWRELEHLLDTVRRVLASADRRLR